MKKLPFIILLLLAALNLYAQKENKDDTVYYLVDTVKTAKPDRMWHVFSDSQYKTYELLCPCLKSNGMPAFFYEINDKGRLIDKSQLKTMKLISLPALIIKAQQTLDTQMISRSFSFIEPKGEKYIVHDINFINPAIHIVPVPDVMESKPDNSAFEIKGLITIRPKEIASYVNKAVIVNTRITDTKSIAGGSIILLTGTNDQDFIILLEDSNQFDSPEIYYKGKEVRITGKVIVYQGQPTIIISNPNQIQIVRTK